MHSPKKSIPSTGSKSNTSAFTTGRNAIKRKTNDKKTLEDMFKMNINDFAFNEETKTLYSLALDYINNTHKFMNKKLYENYGDCGDANSETNGVFRMPDIPNYSTIFSMLLEKSKTADVPVNRVQAKEETRCNVKTNISALVPGIKNLSEHKTLDNLEDTSTKTSPRVNRKGKGVSKPHNLPKQKSDVKDLAKGDDKNCARKLEETSLNKEPKVENRVEMKKTVIENVDIDTKKQGDTNSAQQVSEEDRSEDNSKNQEKVVGIDQESIMDLIKQQVHEELSTLMKSNEKQVKLVSSSHHVVNIQPQLNLLEYAQKKQAMKNLETQSTHFNMEDAQRKVNNLFQRISHESVAHYSREDDEYSDDASMSNRMDDGSMSNRMDDGPMSKRMDDESDSDSVILDDEEFERTHRRRQRDDNIQERAYPEVSHPLKLTIKDMPKLNEKMLNTIGLFTERGDIRPGILDLMEMQKQAKASDARNKQFRVKRQWNLQVQKVPNIPSVSSEKSFLSLSSDLRLNADICKNT